MSVARVARCVLSREPGKVQPLLVRSVRERAFPERENSNQVQVQMKVRIQMRVQLHKQVHLWVALLACNRVWRAVDPAPTP